MIRVENLSVHVGTFSLDSISFEIASGKYAVLMGRTGVGKTTLLESICGLRRISAGRVWLHDREVTALKPSARGIGFVPQEGALFDSMTVREQLGFALSVRRRPRVEIERRVKELAEMLSISHLLRRKPPGLSGGERQRVALGRALAANPGVLCLDEPLSALDDATREEMYALVSAVRRIAPITTLHITHNRAEAACLADVVLLLEGGRIRQIDPRHLAPGADAGELDQRPPAASPGNPAATSHAPPPGEC